VQLDKLTAGWQRSDMVIVAARPAMGKTAFVLSMARNIAVEHNRAVAVFSLEMSSTQLVTRLIASEAGISSEKLRRAT
jgi:replicative DNA helicase